MRDIAEALIIVGLTLIVVGGIGACARYIGLAPKSQSFCDLSTTLFYAEADNPTTKQLIDRHNELIYQECTE